MCTLLIPDYDPEDTQPYPGDIQPGIYEDNEIVDLLRQHCHNPGAIYFIFWQDLVAETRILYPSWG